MNKKNFLQLNDINSYKVSFNLSNYIWNIIIKWDYFLKIQLANNLLDQ